jgi:hypothetical protein
MPMREIPVWDRWKDVLCNARCREEEKKETDAKAEDPFFLCVCGVLFIYPRRLSEIEEAMMKVERERRLCTALCGAPLLAMRSAEVMLPEEAQSCESSLESRSARAVPK